jgi:predicted MFS family arabinose efflux permease
VRSPVVGSLDSISRQWGLADSQSVYLVTVSGVTFAFAAPLLQVGFGHLPRRRQVLLGLTLFIAAALLLAAAPNYPVLLLSRVLMGLRCRLHRPRARRIGLEPRRTRATGQRDRRRAARPERRRPGGHAAVRMDRARMGRSRAFLVIGLAGAVTAALILRLIPDTSQGENIDFATVSALLTRTDTLSAFLVVFFIAAGVYSTYAFIAPIIRDAFHAGANTVSTALVVRAPRASPATCS